jgi:hypothetical protein
MAPPREARPATARLVNGPPNERIGWRLTNTDSARRVRLQYLASPLHALVPQPLFHFLDEVDRGEPLRPHLERYATLPADFIKANGGDRFAPSLHCIDGGEP